MPCIASPRVPGNIKLGNICWQQSLLASMHISMGKIRAIKIISALDLSLYATDHHIYHLYSQLQLVLLASSFTDRSIGKVGA